MKNNDYYRYRAMLQFSGTVTFPNRETLIEFVATLISRDYQDWAEDKKNATTTIPDRREWTIRQTTEGKLTEIYATDYLKAHVAEDGDPVYVVLTKLMKKVPKFFKITFDAETDNEIYEEILKRISQGDKPKDVFPTRVRYTIEGSKTLKRETF